MSKFEKMTADQATSRGQRITDFMKAEIDAARSEGRLNKPEDYFPFFENVLLGIFAFYTYPFAEKSLDEKLQALEALKHCTSAAYARVGSGLLLQGAIAQAEAEAENKTEH